MWGKNSTSASEYSVGPSMSIDHSIASFPPMGLEAMNASIGAGRSLRVTSR